MLICLDQCLLQNIYLKVIILCKSPTAFLCLSLIHLLDDSTYLIFIIIEILLPDKTYIVNNPSFLPSPLLSSFNILLTEKSFFLRRCPVKFEYTSFLDFVIYDANNSAIKKNEWNMWRTCFQI